VWPDQSGRSHRLAGLSRVVVGRVELATLIGDVLVVAGWHGVDPAAPGADAYPRASRVDARVLELPSPPPELAPPTSGDGSRAFLALLDGGSPSGPLVVGVGRVGLLLLPEHLDGAMVDLPTFVDGALVGAGPQVRASAAHFLAQVAPLHAGPEALQVADQLRGAAELLVDRLPGSVISPGIPIGLCVDQLLGLDEHTFYLRGWARVGDGAEGLRTHLSLRSPEGARAELDEIVVRFPRPDVEAFYEASRTVRDNARSGFLACVRLDAPSRLRDGWVVELNDGAGNACEAPAPAVVDDQEIARTTVLGDLTTMESLPGADRPGRRLMASLAHPALSALQDRRCGPGAVSHSIVEVIQHGTPPAAADVSVVVPFYRRIDFLEHQMAAFAADPELCRADLVYVLDSPELARDARTLARELYPLHGVPFRLVLLRRNLGFAGATNAGASLATGRLLLLLNSDVLPDEPGWLSALVAEHDALPEVGAVGPKLLYEDDSIQHAGMWFDKPPGATTWANLHYYKGLSRHFPPADLKRQVPAVTGAAMLLSRTLYFDVGGLAGSFVQGDFEDSDLCLRLRERGLACWYIPSVELYHLEGQSYPDELRRTVAAYNGWLQTMTWDAELRALMAEQAAGFPAPVPDRVPELVPGPLPVTAQLVPAQAVSPPRRSRAAEPQPAPAVVPARRSSRKRLTQPQR